jgi:aromatase
VSGGDSTSTIRYAAVVAAPAHTVGTLLGDLASWPLLFQRVERVELLLGRPPELLARIWVHDRSGLTDFTCRCTPSPKAAGISLRHVVTRPPLSELAVHWTVEPRGPWECVVEVAYEFRVIGDAAETVHRVRREFDRVSDWDLRSMREMAELNGFAGA